MTAKALVRGLPTGLALMVAAVGLAACSATMSTSAPSTASPPTTKSPYTKLHVPTVTSQPLNLPPVHLAEETACLTDAQTIRMAEFYFSTVNGHFGTITELVEAKFLRTASSYFSSIKIGAPVGGYTMVPVPTGPCGPHVVTAEQNSG